MVQHADREGQVERAVLVGRATAAERAVAHGRVPPRGLLDQRGRDVDAFELSGERPEVAVDEAEAAADVERSHTVEVAEPPFGELEQDASLRLEEEVVLASRESDRLLDLLLVRLAVRVERGCYGFRSST